MSPAGSSVIDSNVSPSHPSNPKKDPFFLQPLTFEEISIARDLFVKHACKETSISNLRFSYITLYEPGTTELDRVIECIVYLPPTAPRRIRLSLPTKDIVFDEALAGNAQPVITPDDCFLAEEIAKNSEIVKSTLVDSYGDSIDMSRVVCDPWSVHISEDDELNEVSTSGSRLIQTFLYYKLGENSDEWNHYSHPLHLVPLVDLVSRTVISILGAHRKNLTIPSSSVNYFPSTSVDNTYLHPSQVSALPLKPIEITQPEGPSFQIIGSSLQWHHWKFNITHNYREGVVLHDISHSGRSIAKRLSIVEMAVPYADPNEPFQRKCAFDVGDYGLGYCTTSLKLGCDCLGHIQYLPMNLCDSKGEPYTVENAICIHEEDAGTLHKHVEYRTGKSFVRRSRKLIVSFVATVVNYEYLFYYWFHVDGSFGLEIKLSGMLSTNFLSSDEEGGLPNHGILVSPEVNAQLHQHMFCVRMEPAIDGDLNRVSELNTVKADDSKFGNGFKISETYLENEKEACRDLKIGRSWKISNHSVPVNEISRKPVGYKILYNNVNPSILTNESSGVSKRAAFAQHNLWVTKKLEDENFPAGEFPTQSNPAKSAGIDSWIGGRDETLNDEKLVVWCSFGVLHLPRVEDFPIMPCETTGITFKPDGFFKGNPALDISPVKETKSTCC